MVIYYQELLIDADIFSVYLICLLVVLLKGIAVFSWYNALYFFINYNTANGFCSPLLSKITKEELDVRKSPKLRDMDAECGNAVIWG